MDLYQQLWNDTLEILSKNFSEETFNETFYDVKKVLKEENGIIYVLAPSTYIKSRINNVYSRKILEILDSMTNKKLKFKFVCENEIQNQPVRQFTELNKHNLNINNNFESIVIGESNRLAYLTAMKAAEQPGFFINPLYIFGGVGLGKTHLMQAIGNYISDTDINNKILYVQASDYISDYTKATQAQNMQAFEEKYGNLDVLLVDDIQMLEIGKKTQQEFFKLFNQMINDKKQIVITSDCPATELNGIMDRLTSRFQMGISVDIKKPDLEQRINILKRKLSENSNRTISDEVLNYIAENFTENVRELEGALNRVLLYSEVLNEEITIKSVKDTLEALVHYKKSGSDKNYENALSVISNAYSISISDLIGNSRSSKYVLPRHIAMYILKNHFNLTYSKIGSILNGRDHTTVMNGCNKIESEMKTNAELKMAVESFLKKM